ncbi:MAG: type II toxin-antitoxin system Phd/YefM family antitoxin [Clostridiales bacterium]|nr:type II toxin-antitoxin system Phd/YefM family antitoxin [Clostridiales bacterium]
MININVTNFRKELYNLLNNTIKYNEPVNVSTKNGNAVILSEEEYNNMLETIYLCSVPGMEQKIVDGMNTPIEECISENEVQW